MMNILYLSIQTTLFFHERILFNIHARTFDVGRILWCAFKNSSKFCREIRRKRMPSDVVKNFKYVPPCILHNNNQGIWIINNGIAVVYVWKVFAVRDGENISALSFIQKHRVIIELFTTDVRITASSVWVLTAIIHVNSTSATETKAIKLVRNFTYLLTYP